MHVTLKFEAMKTLIVAVVLLLGAASAGAQVIRWQTDDSCLTLWQNYYPGQWQNPDSVMVDTCQPYALYPYYAKKFYYVDFDSDIFHFPLAPMDTTLQANWRNLDTNYTDLRRRFDSLERSFGKFVLQKRDPSATSGLNSGLYVILFDSVQWIYGMTYGNTSDSGAIGDILGIENAIYLRMPIQEGVSTNPLKEQSDFWPNPAKRYIHISCPARPIRSITVYNSNGEAVRSEQISPPSENFDIPLTGLSAGDYFIVAGGEVFHFILNP